jgi:hypothetical protein
MADGVFLSSILAQHSSLSKELLPIKPRSSSMREAPCGCILRMALPTGSWDEPRPSNSALDVPIVVENDDRAAFGDGVDGLLGMSFLSRFKVTIDTQVVKISNPRRSEL